MTQTLKFILEVEGEDLTDNEKEDLRYILADALADFRRARGQGNPIVYVMERYEGMLEPGSKRFNEKVQQVQDRLDLAHKLHNASVGVQTRRI